MIPKEQMDACLKKLKEFKHHEYRDLNSIAIVGKGGKIFQSRAGAPCYASLLNWDERSYPEDALFIDDVQLPYKITDEHRRYLDWAVNRSPHAVDFAVKDLDILLDYGTILSMKRSAQLVVGAAILIRIMDEYPNIFENWCLLSKYMDETAAYLFAHSMTQTDENKITLYRADNGHKVFGGDDVRVNVLRNWMAHKPKDCVPMYKRTDYTDLVSPWKHTELTQEKGYCLYAAAEGQSLDTLGLPFTTSDFVRDRWEVDLPYVVEQNMKDDEDETRFHRAA